MFRLAVCSLLSVGVAYLMWRRKGFDAVGSIVGGVTLFIHCMAGGSIAVYLLTFFATSVILTRFGKGKKARIEERYIEHSTNSYDVVLANSIMSTLACIILLATNAEQGSYGCRDYTNLQTFLYGLIVGYYSFCTSDIWSSEVGMLSQQEPVSIISLDTVQPGTNGGVTLLGLGAGLCGSLLISIISSVYISSICSFKLIVFIAIILITTISGIVGNFIDSILGWNFQYSGWDEIRRCVVSHEGRNVRRISGNDILTNSQINIIAATFSGIICGFVFFALRNIFDDRF